MKTLNQDIKKGVFKTVYMLLGGEDILKRSYKNRLRDAIVGEDTMNLGVFVGKDVSVEAVISMAETMPFFAERRLIIVGDSGLF